mmetsp:Transcript_40806/g.66172  ORF Transcript_40806/g.66172 Transcript_40806/m.66172 type:complete len:258 (-) Transcript_40806:275-1048(-)|eukprot:CAMPEP_0184656028 /NCGR_PEP_ID=MMETSP0308-20130426/15393_1 /TAXON_ID=38269 /ORGANISM="Gloeochaete witrockiana, Strain SAG 46.84" /LENGTH=257 /DNA_ID=CAMNT_0027092927 /DNA_START=110 /DNA_END=883 /DNA_ORIENTATION=+
MEELDLLHDPDIEKFLQECPIVPGSDEFSATDFISPTNFKFDETLLPPLGNVGPLRDWDLVPSCTFASSVQLTPSQNIFAGPFFPLSPLSPELPSPIPSTRTSIKMTEQRRENKAAREKLRRNELNDKFVVLGNVVGVKSDKVNILNQTMACIGGLRKENDELRAQVRCVRSENEALISLLRRLTPYSEELLKQYAAVSSAPSPCASSSVASAPLPCMGFPPSLPQQTSLADMLAASQADLQGLQDSEEEISFPPVA